MKGAVLAAVSVPTSDPAVDNVYGLGLSLSGKKIGTDGGGLPNQLSIALDGGGIIGKTTSPIVDFVQNIPLLPDSVKSFFNNIIKNFGPNYTVTVLDEIRGVGQATLDFQNLFDSKGELGLKYKRSAAAKGQLGGSFFEIKVDLGATGFFYPSLRIGDLSGSIQFKAKLPGQDVATGIRATLKTDLTSLPIVEVTPITDIPLLPSSSFDQLIEEFKAVDAPGPNSPLALNIEEEILNAPDNGDFIDILNDPEIYNSGDNPLNDILDILQPDSFSSVENAFPETNIDTINSGFESIFSNGIGESNSLNFGSISPSFDLAQQVFTESQDLNQLTADPFNIAQSLELLPNQVI